MSKENRINTEREAMPIMVCLQCVSAEIQIDPRVSNPNYPVIISTCRTHKICNGEYDQKLTQEDQKTQK